MKLGNLLPASLILLLFFSSCERHEIDRNEDPFPFETISVKDEPQLLEWLSQMSYNSKARTTSILDSLDLSEAVRFTDSLGHVVYSLYIPETSPYSLKNVWLYETEDGLTGRLIHYQIDKDWFATNVFSGWDHFNGIFKAYDLEGNLLYSTTMIDGVSQVDGNQSARMMSGCQNSTRTSYYGECTTTLWEVCTGTKEDPAKFGCYYDTTTDCTWYDDSCDTGGDSGSGPTYDPGPSGGGGSTDTNENGCNDGFEYYNNRCVAICKPGHFRDTDGECKLCVLDEEGNCSAPNDPCETVNQLSADDDFNIILEALAATTNENFETGYLVKRDDLGTSYEEIVGTLNDPKIAFYTSDPIEGYLHSHYMGTLSIFSPTDLKAIYDLHSNNLISDIDGFFGGLVTSQGSTYIIQIEDLSDFIAFGDQYLSDDQGFLAFQFLFQDLSGITPDSSVSQNESEFLQLIAELKAGLSLLKSENGDWNNLALNSSNQVVSNPCN